MAASLTIGAAYLDTTGKKVVIPISGATGNLSLSTGTAPTGIKIYLQAISVFISSYALVGQTIEAMIEVAAGSNLTVTADIATSSNIQDASGNTIATAQTGKAVSNMSAAGISVIVDATDPAIQFFGNQTSSGGFYTGTSVNSQFSFKVTGANEVAVCSFGTQKISVDRSAYITTSSGASGGQFVRVASNLAGGGYSFDSKYTSLRIVGAVLMTGPAPVLSRAPIYENVYSFRDPNVLAHVKFGGCWGLYEFSAGYSTFRSVWWGNYFEIKTNAVGMAAYGYINGPGSTTPFRLYRDGVLLGTYTAGALAGDNFGTPIFSQALDGQTHIYRIASTDTASLILAMTHLCLQGGTLDTSYTPVYDSNFAFATGDSNTQGLPGVGAGTIDQTYIAQVGNLVPCPVVNGGKAGARLDDSDLGISSPFYMSSILRRQPKFLVIMAGVNDSGANKTAAQIGAAAASIIQSLWFGLTSGNMTLTGLGAQCRGILWIEPQAYIPEPRRSDYSSAIEAAIEAARQNKPQFAPDIVYVRTRSAPWPQTTDIHFNASQITQLAQAITPYAITAVQPDTTPPMIPSGLIANGNGKNGRVLLSWNANNDDTLGYELSINSGAAIDVGNVTAYTSTGLENGEAYSYRIRAYDNAGPENTAGNRSAWSTEVIARPTLLSLYELSQIWTVPNNRTLTDFSFTVNTNANSTETAIKAKADLIGTSAVASQNDVNVKGDEILDAIEAANAGTGPNAVTITVTDGTNPLQGATVALTLNAFRYTASTNSSGVATFSLSNGTYGVAIALGGYSFTPTTIVVDGAETQTYAMTQQVISQPSDPDKVPAYGYVKNFLGTDQKATITLEYADTNVIAAQSFVVLEGETIESNDNGFFEFPEGVYPSTEADNDDASNATHQLIIEGASVTRKFKLRISDMGGNLATMRVGN